MTEPFGQSRSPFVHGVQAAPSHPHPQNRLVAQGHYPSAQKYQNLPPTHTKIFVGIYFVLRDLS